MTTTTQLIATLRENILALEAFERGEQVEWFYAPKGEWEPDTDPIYSVMAGRSIRIKPKPREWWISTHRNGCLTGRMFGTQRDAVDDCASGVVVHVREVIEP